MRNSWLPLAAFVAGVFASTVLLGRRPPPPTWDQTAAAERFDADLAAWLESVDTGSGVCDRIIAAVDEYHAETRFLEHEERAAEADFR